MTEHKWLLLILVSITNKKYVVLNFSDSLQEIVTALYCKLLIILGLAFPMAEQISHEVSIGTYQLFYVYLYLGSLLFLIFIYFDLIRTKAKNVVVSKKDIVMKKASTISQSENNSSSTSNRLECQISTSQNRQRTSVNSNSGGGDRENNTQEKTSTVESLPVIPRPRVHYGSFYLRVGCVCKWIIFIFWYPDLQIFKSTTTLNIIFD